MQKIKPLLEQTSKGLKKNSSASPTVAGQSKPGTNAVRPGVAEPNDNYGGGYAGDSSNDNELDHVDAINQVFAEFEFAYHNQFHKAFGSAESLVIAKKYWLSSLENYAPHQIVQAAKRLIKTQDYLPSIAALVRACEEGFDLFGLPSPRQAYVEACSAPSPKRQHHWSHEAVYFAGKASGWYLLANEPESRAFPVFDYHYKLLCRRVMNGERLTVDLPTPLSNKVDRKLSPEEAKARIAKLRAELDI